MEVNMSKKDKKSNSGAGGPIVLVFAEREDVAYLKDNLVMQAIYGDQAPVVLTVPAEPRRALISELIWPASSRAETRVALMTRFPDISHNEVDEFIASDKFTNKVIKYILGETGLKRKDLVRVKALIGNQLIFSSESSLVAVCQRFMPNASLIGFKWSGADPELYGSSDEGGDSE